MLPPVAFKVVSCMLFALCIYAYILSSFYLVKYFKFLKVSISYIDCIVFP